MFHLRTWALAVGLTLFGGWAQAQAVPAADPPPAEAYYRRADVMNAQLSPSGRWLAVLSTLGGERSALVVFDVQGDAKPSVAARFTDLDVNQFSWVNDDRMVFDTLDYQLAVGELRWAPGLFSVHRDGSELRMLIEIDRPAFFQRRTGREPLSLFHRLLHVPRDGSDDVIVGEYRYDAQYEPTGIIAKRLNVVTGIATLVTLGAPANVTRFWFDSRGRGAHGSHAQ